MRVEWCEQSSCGTLGTPGSRGCTLVSRSELRAAGIGPIEAMRRSLE